MLCLQGREYRTEANDFDVFLLRLFTSELVENK